MTESNNKPLLTLGPLRIEKDVVKYIFGEGLPSWSSVGGTAIIANFLINDIDTTASLLSTGLKTSFVIVLLIFAIGKTWKTLKKEGKVEEV